MLINVFILEVVTRLLLAPNRKKFFHHPLNIIDMASVIPIYITLTFDLTVGSESDLGDLGRLIQVQTSWVSSTTHGFAAWFWSGLAPEPRLIHARSFMI